MNEDHKQDLTPPERKWAEALARALRTSEARLDAVTAARLSALRRRALDAAGTPPLPAWSWALPGALAAALLVWVLAPWPLSRPATPVNVAEADALEVLTDDADPDFYQELDLYQWLEETNGSV